MTAGVLWRLALWGAVVAVAVVLSPGSWLAKELVVMGVSLWLGYAVGPVGVAVPVVVSLIAWLAIEALRHPNIGSGEDGNGVLRLTVLLVAVPAIACAIGGVLVRRGRSRAHPSDHLAHDEFV